MFRMARKIVFLGVVVMICWVIFSGDSRGVDSAREAGAKAVEIVRETADKYVPKLVERVAQSMQTEEPVSSTGTRNGTEPIQVSSQPVVHDLPIPESSVAEQAANLADVRQELGELVAKMVETRKAMLAVRFYDEER